MPDNQKESKFISGLSEVSANYAGFLMDLWGCVHDGTQLYPGARECLQELKAKGKRVVLLSNAPRRNRKVVDVLEKLGVTADLYHGVLSSGEAAYAALAGGWWTVDGGWEEIENPRLPSSLQYFFIGPQRDADVLHGLPYGVAKNIKRADFILNVGFGSEAQSMDAWDEALQAGAKRKLPMLCLNPDLEVVKITGERYPCAGVIAREYEKLGGVVTYFGKPYIEIYDTALAVLGIEDRTRVLALGDGLHTDVLGARRAGIPSALITGGILKQELGDIAEEEMRKHLAAQDVQADFVLKELSW